MDNIKVEYWVEMADYDLITAKSMLISKRYLYVGFMCHQTIEKILKATFVYKNPEKQPPYIHNLSKLAKESELYIELTDEQMDLIDTLEPLNIEARYPSTKDALLLSLTEERCNKIIEETEALYLWIKQKL